MGFYWLIMFYWIQTPDVEKSDMAIPKMTNINVHYTLARNILISREVDDFSIFGLFYVFSHHPHH